ncbi:MAG: TVP38/TMEM64 family protein [Planctomycetota bacterium]
MTNDSPEFGLVDDATPRRRRGWQWLLWSSIIGLTFAIGWSWLDGGIVFDLLRSDLAADDRIERLRQFFEQAGVLAPLVYFVFVTIEVVVAPLPGLMLYAPGGILFGGFMGGLIALAGNVAGAGIACAVTRSLGDSWLTRFIPRSSLEPMQDTLERRGSWLIFLLRLNPLTSSDLVSYAAGFTRIPVWKVMAATLAGMAPLCFAQSYLAEGVMTAIPQLLYPLLFACLVYVVCVCAVLRRLAVSGRSLAEQSTE